MRVQELLKLLADECRVRLLVLLEEEELSVQELVEITGLGQSRVSRHLGLLRGAGLLRDRREGTWTFYQLDREANGQALPAPLWKVVGGEFAATAQYSLDRAALERVRESRRERSRSAHDRLAGQWRMVGEDLVEGSLRAEALAALAAPDLVVADLGCGAGFFTQFLAERVTRVIAVDHSRAMLDEARKTIPDGTDVELRKGELDALPLADGEVDAVIANLVLHHVPEFGAVAAEIARVLRPGGVAVITDLMPHAEEWMRAEMGDPRLGIDPEVLAAAFREAPFARVERIPVNDKYRMKSAGGRVARLDLFLLRVTKNGNPSGINRT